MIKKLTRGVKKITKPRVITTQMMNARLPDLRSDTMKTWGESYQKLCTMINLHSEGNVIAPA